MNDIIGWIARDKLRPDRYGGFKAHCKMYRSYKTALSAQRGYKQTDEDVLRRWDILPVKIATEE